MTTRGNVVLMDDSTVQQPSKVETAVAATTRRAKGIALWQVIEARQRKVTGAVK